MNPTVVIKVAGDDQAGLPGAALPIAPLVEVRDAQRALQGVEVTFTVEGEGSVETVTVRSDAEGHASPGKWTLGTQAINLLRARAGQVEAVFVAAAKTRPISSDIQVSIESPLTALATQESVQVEARVTSVRALAQISATLGAATSPMTLVTGLGDQFSANLDLHAEGDGYVLLSVEARDVTGSSTTAVKVIRRDRPPKITVQSPTAWSIANPSIGYSFTCRDDFDDAGCVTLAVSVGGERRSEGAGDSLSGTVDLGSVGNAAPGLLLTGTDRSGSTGTVIVPIVVETSTAIGATTVVRGRVIDVRGQRVLFESDSTSALMIRDLSASRDWVVSSGAWGGAAVLTPTGALFVEGGTIREWTESGTTELGPGGAFAAAGAYALWESANGWTTRDLTARVSTSLGTIGCPGLGANGDVVFIDGTVKRWRAGTISQVSAARDAFCPRTDGINTVFQSGASFNYANTVVLSSSTGSERVLAPPGLHPVEPYQLSNGWVGYGKRDDFGKAQVWRAGASGVDAQLTMLGESSTVEAVGEDGSVLFRNQGGRYLAKVGETPKRINGGFGTPIWRDARFLLLIGNTVFAPVP